MPTYAYRCPNGHEFDRFFKTMSAAASELPCAECGAVAARQLSGGAGLLFKGSGFYLTDYGKNAHRKDDGKAAKSKSDGGGGDGGGESAKSETKSEGKTDAAAKPAASESKAGSTKSESSKKPKSE